VQNAPTWSRMCPYPNPTHGPACAPDACPSLAPPPWPGGRAGVKQCTAEQSTFSLSAGAEEPGRFVLAAAHAGKQRMPGTQAPAGSALSGFFSLLLWTCSGCAAEPAGAAVADMLVVQRLYGACHGAKACAERLTARMYMSGAAVWLALEHAWKHPCGLSPGSPALGQQADQFHQAATPAHHSKFALKNSSACTSAFASSPGQLSGSRSRNTSLTYRLPGNPSYTPVLGPACRARSAAAWPATHARSKGGRVPSRRPGWASPGQRMQRWAASQPAQRQACVRHCVLALGEAGLCGSLRSAARGRGGGAWSPARATTPRLPSPTAFYHRCRTWCRSLTVPPHDTVRKPRLLICCQRADACAHACDRPALRQVLVPAGEHHCASSPQVRCLTHTGLSANRQRRAQFPFFGRLLAPLDPLIRLYFSFPFAR